MLSSTTTEWLTGGSKWLQVPAKQLLESGQLNKTAIAEPAALCKREANNKFLDILHIDVDEPEKDFPTYVLDEHLLPKLKDKKPDPKALDIEAVLTAELRIRLEQNEAFWTLSEKLQQIIDEKRAGTLTDIALIEELKSLNEAVLSAVEEAKSPIDQQLALKIKNRNIAMTEAQAAEVAAAILEEADKHYPPSRWNSSPVDPELSRALLLLLSQRFSALGLLASDPIEFIGHLVQVLNRKHYKPGSKDA